MDTTNEQLESWKEIAAYLKRDIRTVQRWEKKEGLPVRRHLHEKLGTVYAYRSEVDRWWSGRQPAPEVRRWPVAAGVAALLAVAGGLWYWSGIRKGRPEMVARRVWAGPDADRLGPVSPDGRYLSYVDPGSGEVFLYDLSSGVARRLTHRATAEAGAADSPVFSPDGKQVAYGRRRPDLNEIRVVGLDGTGDRSVYVNPETPQVELRDWTRDGRHLLALLRGNDGKRRIARLGIRDGAAQTVLDLNSGFPLGLKVSPDGRWAVYDLAPDPAKPRRDLYVLELGSGRAEPLLEHPSNEFLLGWAPDGRTVLFGSDRTGTVDAWALEVVEGKRRGEPRLVRKDLGRVWPMGFTRSGAYYYGLQTGTMDVYLAELDEQGQVRGAAKAAAGQGLGSNRAPDWSPDGKRLAYVSESFPFHRVPEARVVLGEGREMRLDLFHIDTLRWAPDGRSLVATGVDRRLRCGVFRVDGSTGGVESMVERPGPGAYFQDASWSRDGRTLLYKSRDWGVEPTPLYARERDGRERMLLPSVYRFCLSPDGKWIAYSSFDEKSEFIRMIPAAGGEGSEWHRQPRGARIRSLAWMPDGRTLLFARKGELWRLAGARSEPEKAGLAAEDLRQLRVHPGGRQLAFTAGVGKGEAWVMENFLH